MNNQQPLTNGFYNLKRNMTDLKLKKFFKLAIMYSYKTELHILPKMSREDLKEYSIGEFIDTHCSKKSHNVCIDRKLYGHPESMAIGEVGFSVTKGYKDFPTYLYIYMTLDNLNRLVKDCNLELIDWNIKQ